MSSAGFEAGAEDARGVTMGSAAVSWILVASILGSGLSAAYFVEPRWTVTAYRPTLASCILMSGSLADRFGGRRIFPIGVVRFAVASLLCGVFPNIEARASEHSCPHRWTHGRRTA